MITKQRISSVQKITGLKKASSTVALSNYLCFSYLDTSLENCGLMFGIICYTWLPGKCIDEEILKHDPNCYVFQTPWSLGIVFWQVQIFRIFSFNYKFKWPKMHARKLPRISESSFEPNRWMTSLCNGTSASTSKVIKNHMDSEPSIDYGNGTSASTSKVTYEPHNVPK